jgi:nicotinamide riboside kinase
VKVTEIKKIVIVGPGEYGKEYAMRTTGTALQYQWCPEFAREYLLTNGMNYTYSDLLKIAKGQLAMEDEYIQSTVR